MDFVVAPELVAVDDFAPFGFLGDVSVVVLFPFGQRDALLRRVCAFDVLDLFAALEGIVDYSAVERGFKVFRSVAVGAAAEDEPIGSRAVHSLAVDHA